MTGRLEETIGLTALGRGMGQACDQLVQDALAIFAGLPEERQKELMEEQRKSVEENARRDAERRRLEARPEPNWIDRASWIAREMREPARNRWPEAVEARSPSGNTPAHVLWMLEELSARRVGSETKTCRWLGWVQSQLVDFEVLSLEQMKQLNLRSKVEAPLIATPKSAPAPEEPFQAECQRWLDVVTKDDPTDLEERRARFLEESLEWVQSLGMSLIEVIQVAAYVFGRPAGEPSQEAGGVNTTAMVLADYIKLDFMKCGRRELDRCWDPAVIEKIRGKRSRRHGRGPLPGTTEADLVPVARPHELADGPCPTCGVGPGERCQHESGRCVDPGHFANREKALASDIPHRDRYGY